jgi:LruC domain-containing protein
MSAYYNINTAFCNYEDGTIVSFEDHFDDHNCSDVLFALKPQFPTDIPTLGEKEEKSESNIFAFEDLWPAVGDYDMNDVIVSSEYYKTMNGYNDDSYYITKEAFAFTTDQNHSNQTKLDNGLATWFTGTGLNLYVEYSTDSVNYDTLATSKYTVQEENGKTYVYLDKNVKDNLNSIYKVVIKHDYLSQVSTPTAYGCFLYRDDEGKGRWEVHIPYEKPTSNLSTYYSKFLTTDKEYAALSSENSVYYPFAIKLKGATMSNLSGLLNASNESKRIDYIYPNYSKWAKSEGKEYTDWYLQ